MKCQDVGRCGQRLASESHWKRLVVFPPSWHGGAQGKDEYFAQSDFSQVPTGHRTVSSSGGPIRIHTTFQNSKFYPKIKRPLSVIVFVLVLTWNTSNLRVGIKILIRKVWRGSKKCAQVEMSSPACSPQEWILLHTIWSQSGWTTPLMPLQFNFDWEVQSCWCGKGLSRVSRIRARAI